ncbi:ABC transporter ATP-binding protein [Bifidobacterium tibiigranuli]|jgi:peptide/nickel transport system ATP-binding protein|uniref:ABC transporter ATP-binding protein n=1 Tax=Bifidobacterium tibiigranuli TaxID=2172043 RepID=UPI0026EB1F33|nr:ATP-binding cassette domain-containing protein [Bifidobacterium tibiigranuli]MCI1650524.1 ATP-binding cassette domain-containing protein [Bifidobacterium tibiigranuli]MCI2185677.1 ATP-binding cassette domain-containing protein [Bifidobacterium tibiigranuli]MCI2202987.1 ATP-binding cassette domain-containing protein [Bifidobacterium tibiigranuli]
MIGNSNDDFTLSVKDVTKRFGRGKQQFTAVNKISLEATTDSAIGVIGESGSGKSTLARMIVGFEKPTEGTITINGLPLEQWMANPTDLLEYRRIVQYVAQDTSSSFDPKKKMGESIAAPIRKLLKIHDKDEIVQRTETIVSELGLDVALCSHYPRQLSGGQRQRFALARSLVVSPKLLICDEVVSALDVSVQGAVLNLIKKESAKRGIGLVFISHGLPATAFISSDLMVMKQGDVVEAGSVQEVIEHPRHEYTKALLHAYSYGQSSSEQVLSEQSQGSNPSSKELGNELV